jgi:hypothetical protein
MLTKGPDTQSPTYSCRDPEGLPAEARGQDITEGLSETPETPAQEVAEDEDGYWAAQSAVEAAAFLGLDPAADNSPDAGYYYPPTKVKPCRDPKELMIRVAEAVGEQLRQLDERWPRQIAPATAKRWGRETPPELPDLMKPDGAGYMPLSCAVQWIATHGGTLEINPLDEGLWREAFKDLRDHIASGDVKVVGERPDGVSEDISGAHFASCSVDYPFSDRRILGNEFCLVSHPYLDDEHWRHGFDDRLENRRGVRWRRLQALKADVARCWPFGKSQDHRTGEPGRPSGMYLVKEEHRRRFQRGVAQTRVAPEARDLAEWFRAKHPDAPPLKAKTIENNIRSEHRQRVAERSKTPRN